MLASEKALGTGDEFAPVRRLCRFLEAKFLQVAGREMRIHGATAVTAWVANRLAGASEMLGQSADERFST